MNYFAHHTLATSLFLSLLTAVPSQGAAPYQLDTNFPRLPPGIKLDAVSAVAVDFTGNIAVIHRGREPILIFTPTGKFLRSFGNGLFDSTHGLRRDTKGNLWTTDNKNHTVLKFGHDGKLLLTLGKRNMSGDDDGHFNRPADIAFAKNGNIFIADGYGNSRVVKLDASGKFLHAWGRKGKGPGEFNLPHAIRIDSKGHVYVGDRENDRVQVFDQNGKFIRQFGGFAPYGLEITKDDYLFVADGRANKVMKITLEGKVLAQWGTLGSEPGNFNMPHGITVANDGTVYVTEIRGKRVQKFVPR